MFVRSEVVDGTAAVPDEAVAVTESDSESEEDENRALKMTATPIANNTNTAPPPIRYQTNGGTPTDGSRAGICGPLAGCWGDDHAPPPGLGSSDWSPEAVAGTVTTVPHC